MFLVMLMYHCYTFDDLLQIEANVGATYLAGLGFALFSFFSTHPEDKSP